MPAAERSDSILHANMFLNVLICALRTKRLLTELSFILCCLSRWCWKKSLVTGLVTLLCNHPLHIYSVWSITLFARTLVGMKTFHLSADYYTNPTTPRCLSSNFLLPYSIVVQVQLTAASDAQAAMALSDCHFFSKAAAFKHSLEWQLLKAVIPNCSSVTVEDLTSTKGHQEIYKTGYNFMHLAVFS